MTLSQKAIEEIFNNISDAYWRRQGQRQIHINNLSATFYTRGRSAKTVRFITQTEKPIVSDLLNELGSADVFWDIGANIGYYSCFAGQVCEVVPFEPSPLIADRCDRNLNKNMIDSTTRQLALFDRDGSMLFDAAQISGANNTIEVETRCGDSLVESSLNSPTVLKIDVEGAEGAVLRGLENTLRQEQCRLVYCEIHPSTGGGPSLANFGDSSETVKSILDETGFEFSRFTNRDREYFLKAWKG